MIEKAQLPPSFLSGEQVSVSHGYTSWPTGDNIENPYHCEIMRGWYCREMTGNWDLQKMRRDLPLLFSRARMDHKRPNELFMTIIFEPTQQIFVVLNSAVAWPIHLQVWTRSEPDSQQWFQTLQERYLRKQTAPRDPGRFTVMGVSAEGQLTSWDVPLSRDFPRDRELQLHYGGSFAPWHAQFVQQLKTQRSSISILRGEPGTGKTSYLRHLIYRLRRSHRFYYLPLSMYSALTAPTAIPFWLNENRYCNDKVKVVVIEDAESLLVTRGSDNMERLSDLLNISDGFLGEVLKVHVICTLNAQVDQLDDALLRAGRLLTMREFKRLSAADAQNLARAKRLTLRNQKDYSLAEIYAGERPGSATLGSQRKIGFAI